MNLSQFQAVLTAKHPQAQVSRSKEVGGMAVKNGLTITLTPNGKMYQYQGSFYAIAQQLGLIEKWYVLENGSVVDEATGETEANEKMAVKLAQAIKQAEAWGYTVGEFTIRKVG